MAAIRETEKSSNYDHLERMSVRELLVSMNKEDQTVPNAVQKVCGDICFCVFKNGDQ